MDTKRALEGEMEKREVATLWDLENLKFSLQERNLSLDIAELKTMAARFGRVVVARAYCDFTEYVHKYDARALYSQGVQPVFVPVKTYAGSDGGLRRKNAVDGALSVDAIELLYQYPVDVVVLAAGDSDYAPLVQALRRHGKYVVVMSPSWSLSSRLASHADEVIHLDPPEQQTDSEDVACAVARVTRMLPEIASAGDSAAVTRLVATTLEVVGAYHAEGKQLLLSQLGLEVQRGCPETFSSLVKGRLSAFLTAIGAGTDWRVSEGAINWAPRPVPAAVEFEPTVESRPRAEVVA